MLPTLLASSAQESRAFSNIQKRDKKKKSIVAVENFRKWRKYIHLFCCWRIFFFLCPPTHILFSPCDHNNNLLEYDQTGDPLRSDIDLLFVIFL